MNFLLPIENNLLYFALKQIQDVERIILQVAYMQVFQMTIFLFLQPMGCIMVDLGEKKKKKGHMLPFYAK